MVTCPLSGEIATRKFAIKSDELVRLYKFKRSIDLKNEFETDTIEYYEVDDIDFGFFSPFKAGSQYFYDRLTEQAKYKTEKREYETASKYAYGRLLDVGCGYGWFKKYAPKTEYFGLELGKAALQHCKSSGLNVSSENLFDHSGTYDTVVSFQVLEHVEKPLEFVKAMAELSKRYVIISVPNKRSYMSASMNNYLNLPPHHISWWSETSLRYVAHKLGLNVVYVDEEPAYDDAWKYIALSLQGLLGGKLVDTSLLGKLKYYTANALGSVIGSRFPQNEVLRGHSITIVFEV